MKVTEKMLNSEAGHWFSNRKTFSKRAFVWRDADNNGYVRRVDSSPEDKKCLVSSLEGGEDKFSGIVAHPMLGNVYAMPG